MNRNRGLREARHVARRTPGMRRNSLAMILMLAPLAFGGSESGLVGGVARDAATGKPGEDARIVAHPVGQGADRTTVTSADGIFTFTDLEPGRYEFAAMKSGFQKSTARVDVAARRASRVELDLEEAVT